MRRFLLFAALIFGCSLFAQAQTPTGQLISGATTGNVVRAMQVDSNGVVAVQGVSGGTPAIVQTTPNATYPTAFAGLPVTTIVATSSTVATATTVLIGTLYCVNTTASAATMLVTNTAGTYLVGGAAGFSIPANSDVTRNFTSGLLAVGIKWWSGTASALNCSVTGWQ